MQSGRDTLFLIMQMMVSHTFFLQKYILIPSKIADVGNPKTPAPLASANIGNGDPPYPPKTCRRLKWMVPWLTKSGESRFCNKIGIGGLDGC